MKLKPHQRVSYETAVERALKCLAAEATPVVASWVGKDIWPDNNLRAQGLGAAASRILTRMVKDGLARWTIYYRSADKPLWGYQITLKGRRAYEMIAYGDRQD